MRELTYEKLNSLQKLAVRHAHPANLVLHLLSFLWGGYFLWTHHWILAVIFLAGLPSLGEVIARNDERYLQTVRVELNLFHQLLIYHSKGISLTLNIIAYITFVVGLWSHSAIMILVGISCFLVGQVLAWMKHAHEEAQYSLAIGED